MPKISALGTIDQLTSGSILPVVDNNVTQKVTLKRIVEFVSASIDVTFATEIELLQSASSITSSLNAFASASTLSVASKLSTSSFEAYTASIQSVNLNPFLSSSTFNTYTSSYKTDSSSFDNRIDNLELINVAPFLSSSTFNTFTSSYTNHSSSIDSRLDVLEGISVTPFLSASTFNSYTSSNESTNTTQNSRLVSLENNSGSYLLKTETGSFALTSNLPIVTPFLSASTFNNYTSSNDSKWSTLGGQTGSYILSSQTSSFITEAETGSFLTSLPNELISGSGRIIELGFATTSSVLNIDTSSLVTTSSFNTYTASISTASLVSRLNQIESVSGSWITESETSSFALSANLPVVTPFLSSSTFNTFSSSINTFTSSANTALSNVYTATSSLNTFTSSINTTIKTRLSAEGVISGSSQILNGSGIYSSSVQLPSGLVSSSAQITNLGFSNTTTSSLNYIFVKYGDGTETTVPHPTFVHPYFSPSGSINYGIESSSLYYTSSHGYFELSPYKTYELEGNITIWGSGNVKARWFNLNTNSYLGSELVYNAGDGNNSIAKAIIFPTSSIRVGLKVTTSNWVGYEPKIYGHSYLLIKEIGIGIIDGTGSADWGTISGKPNGLISGSSQLPSGLVSGSSQVLNGSNILSSSVQTFTDFSSSIDSRVGVGSAPAGTISSSIQITNLGFATTSSLAVVTPFLSSSIFNTFATSSNTFTASVNTTTASLNTFSSSVNTFTASVNITTASLNGKTGSYATTGSNQFKDNQTITGSLTVTSLTTISSSISANSSSLYLSSGSNLFVQNDGIVQITGSLNVRGATRFETVGGDEGGEIEFGIPTTNTTLSTRVVADIFQNRLRIFDGNTNGVYIDLSKAPTGVSGELTYKNSGIVNAGDFVQLDNLKATVSTSGNRSLSIASVSGTFTAWVNGTYGAYTGGAGGGGNNLTVTTTAALAINWNFTSAGDCATYIINDTTNNRVYRVTMLIMGSYLNNFISIERLH